MVGKMEEHVEEQWNKAEKKADMFACQRFRHRELSHMRRGIWGRYDHAVVGGKVSVNIGASYFVSTVCKGCLSLKPFYHILFDEGTGYLHVNSDIQP
jgi:hypothetical protein